MKKTAITALLLLVIAGCQGYQVTVNDRELYSPPQLFNDYQVPDAGLRACINQTIADQRILRAEQLTALICTYAGIESLQGLNRFTQLTTINLANNRLINIKPLMFLGQLQRVNLTDNPDLNCLDIKSLSDLLPSPPITSLDCPE
ncbi:MAG: leucine-rich repeat domain-containing protein [Porticoccaceae bacterium]